MTDSDSEHEGGMQERM
jgi:hypothetical protein